MVIALLCFLSNFDEIFFVFFSRHSARTNVLYNTVVGSAAGQPVHSVSLYALTMTRQALFVATVPVLFFARKSVVSQRGGGGVHRHGGCNINK